MADKVISLLGLMRRANAIEVGEINTGSAARAGKAKLLLLAKDASDNARRRAEAFTAGRRLETLELPYNKSELEDGLGLSGCSMAAITDIGFANALMKLLCAADTDKYSGTAERVAERNARAIKRKAEAKTHDRNMRSGKRRTNA